MPNCAHSVLLASKTCAKTACLPAGFVTFLSSSHPPPSAANNQIRLLRQGGIGALAAFASGDPQQQGYAAAIMAGLVENGP
jgi:hypothetical protein